MNDLSFLIIVPVYNTEKYLNRILSSIAKQTFPIEKIEVVIVNDASPNRNECNNIVENWKERLCIQYIALQENKGTHFAKKNWCARLKWKVFFAHGF